MTSNNTDWRFGETNGQYIEEQAQAETAIRAGEAVKLDSAGGDGHLPNVVPATGNDNVYGFARFDADAGKNVILLHVGYMRPRTVADATAPPAFGQAVALKGGKLVAGGTAAASKPFAVNIGGTLANGDTGLLYVNTIAGLVG